jgi:SAM-dependent methyltransferase
MHPLVAKNRELWDESAEINYRSAFYDVAGFKATRSGLDAEVLAGIGDLAGKSVLHLQCHFGMDTLRLAMLAADVVGVDFSPVAIAKARALATELAIPAQFIESDIYALPEVLDRRFDLVFTSYGVLGWLPDLAGWAAIVARYVKPGGRFFLIEGHPTMWMFDDNASELRVHYPYFFSPEPIVVPPKTGNYADPSAAITKTEYSWPHHIGEPITALATAGLRIEEVREYRHTVWRAFPFMLEEPGDRFVFPPELPQIPLMFSIRASG